jgi:peptidoglycan/xylan/chitin deacetylase (PgdA/CDA1 family)
VEWGRRSLLGGLAGLGLPSIAPAAAAPVWPGGARAAVSLSYDDGLDSHPAFAGPSLSARGFRGTFFLTLENMQDRVADWRGLALDGHELCNHTVHHVCGLPRAAPKTYFTKEVLEAQLRFETLFEGQPKLFAYPCGATDLGRGSPNAQLRRYHTYLQTEGFLGARTSDGPPMSPSYARRHRFALNASAPTYERDATEEAFAYLDMAQSLGRWAILVFHGLGPKRREPGDTSTAVHDAILDHIANGPFWCAPIGEVLRRVEAFAV